MTMFENFRSRKGLHNYPFRAVIRVYLLLLTGIFPYFLQAQEIVPLHRQQWEYYRAHPEAVEANDAFSKSGGRNFDQTVAVNKVVYGFHPYWISAATASGYDFSLLTHMAYFSADVDTSASTTGGFMSTNSWNSAQSVTYALNAGIKVHLTVVMFANHSRVLGTAAYRTNLVNNIITLLNNRSAHGAVIDFESMSSSSSTNFKLFIKELGDTLAAHGKELAICLPAVDWSNIFNATFFSYNNSVVTYYFLMAYDYYWRGSANAGPCAPLTTGTSIYHVTRSINTYTSAGATAAKLIAGFPYYGYNWPVVSNARMAATSGNASSITYANAKTAVAGIAASDKFFDATYNTPWYRYQDGTQWRQVWFDDSLSLAMKYDSVKAKGLAGTGMWALSYDGSNTELWGALRNAFGVVVTPTYTVFDNFEISEGHFNLAPTYSGSTTGISKTSSAVRTATTAKSGNGSLKVTLIDSTALSLNWRARLLSGGGNVGSNTAVDADGYISFWLKTSTATSGAQVAITVDDLTGETELSPKLTVNNDGNWNYYEFNLRGTGWTSFASGSGTIDAASITLDAIVFYSNNTAQDWILYVDDVNYLATSTLPVELTSFQYSLRNGIAQFAWETKTETNTSHFVVEREHTSGRWRQAGAVSAAGNSNVPQKYSFTDAIQVTEKTNYRLKTIDNDGSENICKIVSVEPGRPSEFRLEQNYPNPFNPQTVIGVQLAEAANIQLRVFAITGEEVFRTEYRGLAAGHHAIPFSGAQLSGGVYFYQATISNLSGNNVLNAVKKMVLLK